MVIFSYHRQAIKNTRDPGLQKRLTLFHITGRKKRRTSSRRSFVFLPLLALIFLFPLSFTAQSPPKKVVLILTGADPNHPGFSIITTAITSAVRKESPGRVEFLYELQENFVIPPGSREEDEKTSAYLTRKYGDRKIDLVLGLVAPRFREFLKTQPGLFKDIPKVFYDFEAERDTILGESGPHVTGVWAKIDLTETLDIAFKLQPDAKRVVVAAGNSFVDKQTLEQAKAEFRRYEDRVPFTYLTDLTLDDLRTRLAALPRDSIVIFLIFRSDPAGNKYAGPEAIAAVAPTSGAPIYGMSDPYLGSGIVGGSLVDFASIGNRLGEVSLRILSGETVESIPSQTTPNRAIFDWRELQRWGISEQSLPDGSIVQFRQPTVWEEYKWYAIGLIAAVIVEALLIAWLLYLRYRRRQAEIEAARLSSRLQLAHQAARMGTFEWNIQTGTNIWSPELETMYGLSPGAFAQTQPAWEDLVHPEDRDRAQLLVQNALETGEPAEGEWRVLWPDDSLHWIFGRFQAFMDDAGKPSRLSGINIDITERKAAEEALRESESFNRTILSSLNTHVCVLDRYGRIISVNHSWAAFALKNGLASDASVGPGVNYLDVCRRAVTDGNELARLALDGVRAVCDGTQEYFGLEYPCHSPTEKRWFLMIVTPLQSRNGGAVVVHNDITDSKLAAEAVRESEERFRNMAETAPVMIWITDENQATTYVNKKWLQFTGSALELELGHAWTKHLHRDDLGPTVERGNAAFEKRVPFELEFRLRRADGDYRWVISSGAPRFSSEGDFLGYIGTSIDITERKQSEDALKQAHDELKELKNQLEAENIYLQEELRQDQAFGDIVGESSAIKYVHFKVSQVAPTDSTVLITGETGTGKELVAHAIHDASKRKDRPLIKVNCAALSPSLIESELFGHERGAFTGAAARKLGRFELANTGTLLLDEIGELPLDLQSKLLRVLQEGEFERVGGGTTIKADVRIIASTNRDLKQAVEKGTFRNDLWYRLNVFPITTPPLRDRRDDIPILTEHFARTFARKFGKELTGVSPEALKALCTYSWPGNVRELANVIERAIINLRGSVLKIQEDFPMRDADRLAASVKTLEDMERDHICQVLEDLNWRIDGPKGAARVLGINPSTLRTRMGKLGINKPNGRPGPMSADR